MSLLRGWLKDWMKTKTLKWRRKYDAVVKNACLGFWEDALLSRHVRLWTDELCFVSDPMLLNLTAAGIVLLILLVLLVTCVAVWRKRKVTHSRVITQNQSPCSPVPVFWNACSLARFHLLSWCFPLFSVNVESYDSTHDYEKVDGEKAEHADLGDRLSEDSFQGEPFGGSTAEDEEEADYVNVTTECNVQFVEIYGEGVSSSNVPVLNATSEDEEFIDIYGEEDCIYQNMGLGWSKETNTLQRKRNMLHMKCDGDLLYIRYLNSLIDHLKFRLLLIGGLSRRTKFKAEDGCRLWAPHLPQWASDAFV